MATWIVSHDDYLINLDHAAFITHRRLKSGQYEVYAIMTKNFDELNESDSSEHIAITDTEAEARALMIAIGGKLNAIDPDACQAE